MNTDLLIIYIRNSRDIYALTEWLQNTLLKKVNRGLTPSVEYLANCSTMKKIVRMAAKMLSDQDHKTATKQEKEQAAREHAAYIIGCVEYLSRWHYIAKFIRTCNTLLIISYVLFNAAFIRCRGVYLRHRSQKIKRLHK